MTHDSVTKHAMNNCIMVQYLMGECFDSRLSQKHCPKHHIYLGEREGVQL